MQTTLPNVFALKNSGLQAFLYAEVGAEMNGSALTVLSMIARLDQDPWAEAARWATLPRAEAVESLAQRIAQIPLVPSALAETRVTAARLLQLLPAAAKGACQGVAAKAGAASVPGWLHVTILYFALAFGMVLSALVTPRPSQAVVTRARQSVIATHAAVAAPPFHDGPVTG